MRVACARSPTTMSFGMSTPHAARSGPKSYVVPPRLAPMALASGPVSVSAYGSASTMIGLPATAHASMACSMPSVSLRGCTSMSAAMPSGSLSAAGSMVTTSACSRSCWITTGGPFCCIGLRGSMPPSSGMVLSRPTFGFVGRPTEEIARSSWYSSSGSFSGERYGMVSLRSVGPRTTRPSVSVRPLPSTASAGSPAARASSSASLNGSGSMKRTSTFPFERLRISSRYSRTRCAWARMSGWSLEPSCVQKKSMRTGSSSVPSVRSTPLLVL